MQSLFYGAAAASVAGLLLGAGFRTAPQPPAQPQPDAVYSQDQAVAEDGFQPAYLQGAVYTSAAYDWATADRPSQAGDQDKDAGEARLARVSYDADPPPHGDDIPTPNEPASAPATAPSSTSPGSSTTPAPGAPSQQQDDQNTPASRSSTATPSPRRSAPAQQPSTQPTAPSTTAPAPGQPGPEAMTPQGPQDEG